MVNIILPSNVGVQAVRVTEGRITGADMLIGMDIITLGDFSVTNFEGRTVMTFRIPSCHEIDYVRDIEKENREAYLPKPKRKSKKKKNKRK